MSHFTMAAFRGELHKAVMNAVNQSAKCAAG
jgi:hypothetical protein